ncbi:MAG: hypothetical protein Q8P18_29365, partial [Pseudomonadota bacterium]|nr:hypothetical protein [Pseudomonadota bacterium]
ALALLLLAPAPTWSVPPAIAVAEGPVLEYPVPASGWPLYAAARDDVSTSGGLPGAAPPGLEEVMGREGWSLVALQTWAKTHGFRTLRVDEAAGQGAAVALLLGDLAPIGEVDAAAPAWPDVHLVAHGTPDPVPPLPERPTIPPSDDWAWRDPELVQFLDAGFASRARYLLRLYTSPDGLDWTRAAAPFAHSFTSLGLTMVGDEALIVSGTPGLTASLAREFPRMHPASVMAFTTTDLENWGVRRWWLDRKLSVVDPQIDADADGLRLTAWMRTGALGTDPISLTGDHPVFEARLGADGRFHPETPYASLPWLADPVRVQGWLYATSLAPGTAPRVVILGPGPDGWAEVDSLPGLSVPFVTKPGRTWSMLIHQPEEAGHVRVARSTSLDGRAWWAPIPLRLPEGAGCESPVGAKFRGTFVLLCSERLGGAEIF